MSILEIHNLAKSFTRYRGEWRRVGSWFGIAAKHQKENWVLRDIAFSVASGEAMGIIGENGAGKSTLLKLIAGTLRPTQGVITSKGRISAILELGMGFNPELSGRENVWHVLGLMGFSRRDILGLVDEVWEFSELNAYFTQPVRTYSSGMRMRLAFATATAQRPDILIVDEALSVGDAYFQHKSFARIRAFQTQGTALLIVSHDRNAIQSICSRVLLLHEGSLIHDGEPTEVLDFYNALLADKKMTTIRIQQLPDGRTQTRSGSGEASIESICLVDVQGELLQVVSIGQIVKLCISIHIFEDIPELVLGYMLKDASGRTIFGINTWHCGHRLQNLKAGERLHFSFCFAANLGVGNYSVSAALHAGASHAEKNYDWADLMLTFEVVNTTKLQFIGTNPLLPKVVITPQPNGYSQCRQP